ncbi:MAG: MFS transporter [Actinomycetia bacterium]|nr:MFS transporter [Actinomycetes bacterium]
MTVNQPLPVASPDQSGVKEHKGLLVGAAAMMTGGVLTTFLSPLLAVSFAREFDFGIADAGLLVSGGLGSVALSAFAVLPFLPRLDRRAVGISGALLAAAGLALTGFASTFGVVLALQIAIGIGAGLCYACANSALAFARRPERAFSIVTITWMLAGAAMLALGPTLHTMWPKLGVCLGLAVAELVCVVFMTRLTDVRTLTRVEPDEARLEPGSHSDVIDDAQPATPSRSSIVGPAIMLVVAAWLIQGGNLMIWTFAESIGQHSGLSAQSTANFLGLSQLMGLVGAGVTMAFGAKVDKMFLVVPAVLTLAIGNLAVGTATNPLQFIVGFLAVSVAYFCLVPLLLALAAELDTHSGQLVVLVGAGALVAGGVAPAVGGWIAGAAEHWPRLGVTALAVVLLALPLMVTPVRAAQRRVALSGMVAPD